MFESVGSTFLFISKCSETCSGKSGEGLQTPFHFLGQRIVMVVFSITWRKYVLLDVRSRKVTDSWGLLVLVHLSRNKRAFAELLRLCPVIRREEVRKQCYRLREKGQLWG